MICIIGGGASGLACAAMTARQTGEPVTILERMERVGKKLLATGNGRCNLTNTYAPKGHYRGDSEAALKILAQFDVKSTIGFFESIGVSCIELDGGKVYPRSLQASAVLDCLRSECARLGVSERCGVAIAAVKRESDGFVLHTRSSDALRARAVVVAAGGKSQSNLGSDGSGYGLLKGFGHTITPLYPALTQLKTKLDYIRPLEGVKLEANLTAVIGGKAQRSEAGELLFAAYGVSGPPVFQLSSAISAALCENPNVHCDLIIDFLPDLEADELSGILAKRAEQLSHLPVDSFFTGFLHKRLGQCILNYSGIAPLGRICASIKDSEISAMTSALKSFELPVREPMPFANAQVTGGGALLSEFDKNLMSKKAPGLYACGEILNVEGDCGGYNLQWAWSSACACARGLTAQV